MKKNYLIAGAVTLALIATAIPAFANHDQADMKDQDHDTVKASADLSVKTSASMKVPVKANDDDFTCLPRGIQKRLHDHKGLPPGIAKKLHCHITPTPNPLLIAVTEKDVATSSVTIQWHTFYPSKSTFVYSTESDLSPITGATVESGSFMSDHSVTLGSLAPDTVYFYKITATDQNGRTVETSVRSFRTDRQ